MATLEEIQKIQKVLEASEDVGGLLYELSVRTKTKRTALDELGEVEFVEYSDYQYDVDGIDMEFIFTLDGRFYRLSGTHYLDQDDEWDTWPREVFPRIISKTVYDIRKQNI